MRGSKPEAAIEQAIERGSSIVRGEHVIVACSGGVDSVALAAALAAVAKPMELTLTMAHVNHGTRESAWQDECVALRVAASLGLAIRIVALERVPGAEAGLREARYAALERIARDCGASAVATAHHAEDQSETVLLALLRGAGPDGLSGIPARRRLAESIDLVRPLLRIPAAELRYYCHVRALPYAVDPTNADAGLRRNAVRRALEALRPLFPGLDEAVARTAEIVTDEERQTQRAHLRRRVRQLLGEQDELRDVDFEHVESAVCALERGGSGRFYMKPGIELRIQGGTLESGINRQ